ncbi:MAG: hypothetical protein ACLFV1_06640 [Thiohalophilus sp.]
MFDLNAMHDDEGRPVSERRADAMARVGVEMEMKLCPFHDIRKDRWMNVSALEQITHYLNPVLEEMAAFRRLAGGDDATWDDILACVIDQLSGPAVYLLQQRSLHGPVPARIAVGHKLAAGMFGVMRGLCERRALGTGLPVSVDTFMDLIEETGALLGATYEACAGSMPMIRKACTALIEGNSDNRLQISPLRIELARNLALQVQLGVFWHLYDQVHLWSLLRGELRENLTPCNSFLQNKLEHAGNNLAVHAPSLPNSAMLPDALDAALCQRLTDALNDAADPSTLKEDRWTAAELLEQPGSPIPFDGSTNAMAERIAGYLHTYRLFETELSGIERELRQQLGFPLDTPISLGDAALPTPQALSWYEFILGRRLGADGRLTGKSIKIKTDAPTK